MANPFFLPPKPGNMPMFFRKYACLLSKCAWKEIKAWQKKSRGIKCVGYMRYSQFISLSISRTFEKRTRKEEGKKGKQTSGRNAKNT